ncbi:hypothetical protein GOEFS_055_00330 [Gordonia effusa NBRC 100432]|uniref:Mce-associated membrane protein n=1 Tax=Gordonia effusa NBRC 100432 TaxID=1077974 RepID=H0R0B9_9ACTN|nr:hypothetical protein [Gordonia effusa]GAB18520.1 hypothetical protein GOEFS_055_00330 [Gordonia effusa NBRC 100432]
MANRKALSRRNIAWTVYGVALVAAIAVTVVLGVAYFSARSTEKARESAVSSAKDYATTMFGYTPKNIDDHITRSQTFVTGEAAKQYKQWTVEPKYGDTVRKDNIVSSAVVQDAGVVENTRDTAKVLIFVNQSVSRGNKEDVRVDPSRVTFDMIRTGGIWKIQNIDVLTDTTLRQLISKETTPPPGAKPLPPASSSVPAPSVPVPTG